MRTLTLLFTAVCLSLLPLAAQQRGSIINASRCEVSTLHQMAQVNDAGAHTVSLDQRNCKWERPFELGGSAGTDYVSTGVDDVQFDAARDRGYVVGALASGDKYFLYYEGTSTMKNGAPVHLEGHWSFSGGTGKLQGLSGSGNYSAAPAADGSMRFDIVGEYELLSTP